MVEKKVWEEWSDKDLADEAQSGVRGQGAVVEAMRRLREAIVKQQQSTNRLTIWLIVLTVVLLVLSVMQVIMVFLN